MSTLHIVNKSPFETGTLVSCLERCAPNDAVLLIEDGIYGALEGSAAAGAMGKQSDKLHLYALAPDLEARGIGSDRVMADVKPIGYGDFVDLVTTHDKSVTWL